MLTNAAEAEGKAEPCNQIGPLIAPPPPSPKVLAQLAKLEGVQREVEREQQTTEQLLAEVSTLRRKVAQHERTTQTTISAPSEAEVQRRIREAVSGAAQASARAAVTVSKAMRGAVDKIAAGLQEVQAELAGVDVSIVPRARTVVRSAAPAPRNGTPSATVEGLRAGAVRILQELAARAPAGYSRPQVGGLTQFAHKGGTFTTYIGDLRRSGFVEERSGLMYATEVGIAALGDKVPAAPTSHDEAMALWRKALRSGAFAMLEAVVEHGRDGISRDELASVVGMTASGGTFTTYLGDLRRNGLITEQHKRCTANDILFPSRRP